MDNWLGLRVGNEGNLLLEINKTENNVGVGEEKWCILSLELKNSNINLTLEGEIITDAEIKEIVKNLKNIIDGKLSQVVIFETLEPYFEFVFDKDNVRINIKFNASNDYYSLYLDKFNIKQLIEYLNNMN